MFQPLFSSQVYIGKLTLLLDLQADELALSDGDPVSAWNAKIGNFTQTGSASPTFKIVGGFPCVRFDGIDDWMLGQNWAALDNLSSFTTFIVVENWEQNIISKISNDGCSDPGATGWSLYWGAQYLYTSTANNISQNVSALGVGKTLYTFEVISKAEMHAYLNGTLNDFYPPNGNIVGSGAGNISNTEPVRLGIDGQAGNCDGFCVGDFYAISIYSPAPTALARARVEAQLAARYGITL